jgi:hypothetical protein
VQLQVVLDGIRRVEHLALAQLLGHRAARQLQHRHQLGALGRAQALDAVQVFGAGVQQAGDAAKTIAGGAASIRAALAPSAARPCPPCRCAAAAPAARHR